MFRILFATWMLFFLLLSTKAMADASALCYGCSGSEKNNLAMDYALNNISPNEAQQGVKKKFHIIDMNDGSVATYEVYKIYQYIPYLNPPTFVYSPAATPINTSSSVLAKANELKQEINALSDDLDLITIPADVIESAWEIPDCSYCANNISDYLNSSEDVSTHFSKVENVMNWLNVVQGKLNEIWVVKLSDGGKVHLKFDLIQQDTIIEVEIVKVVDANNNRTSGGI